MNIARVARRSASGYKARPLAKEVRSVIGVSTMGDMHECNNAIMEVPRVHDPEKSFIKR